MALTSTISISSPFAQIKPGVVLDCVLRVFNQGNASATIVSAAIIVDPLAGAYIHSQPGIGLTSTQLTIAAGEVAYLPFQIVFCAPTNSASAADSIAYSMHAEVSTATEISTSTEFIVTVVKQSTSAPSPAGYLKFDSPNNSANLLLIF